MTDHTFPVLVARTGNAIPASLATRLADTLLEWMDRARSRHSLARLTESELKDIGLSRSEVGYEVRKPFWRG